MSMVDFPEHWKMVRFGEVVTFTKKPRDLRYSEYDEVPFLPMDLIPIGKLSSEKFILKTNEELSSGTYFEPGDVLLAKITPSFENGKQCIIEDLPTPFGLATTEVIPIREVVDVSDRFYLFYYLLLPDVRVLLAGRMQGTTGRQRLGKETLANLEIPLPPLPEQRAIAHVLQTIQEAKSARQRELALERERKAALMDYLFSHGTKGEPRKQTEVGNIPESWEVVRLEDVCTFTTGKLNSEQAKADGRYPFFTCSQETFRIDSYSFDQEAILLAGNNARGIFSVKYYKGRFDAYQRTYVITIKDTKQLSYQYFLYDLFLKLELLKRRSIGATTKYLTTPIIKNLGLTLPSSSEQLMISSVLWSCDEKIAALEQEAERLDELFHAMLDELMTGKRSAVSLIDAELPN